MGSETQNTYREDSYEGKKGKGILKMPNVTANINTYVVLNGTEQILSSTAFN